MGVRICTECGIAENGVTEPHVLVSFLRRQRGGEEDRIGGMCHDEQVLRLVIGPFSVLDLGIHVQAYFGGRGALYLQIILEVVGKVVDVVVERVNLRRIQQTAIMVHVETHVIAHARAAALEVHIGALAHGHIFKKKVAPVNVGIYVRIDFVARVVYALLAVHQGSGASVSLSFIV